MNGLVFTFFPTPLKQWETPCLFSHQNKGFINDVFCRNWAVRNPAGTRLDSSSLVNKQFVLYVDPRVEMSRIFKCLSALSTFLSVSVVDLYIPTSWLEVRFPPLVGWQQFTQLNFSRLRSRHCNDSNSVWLSEIIFFRGGRGGNSEPQQHGLPGPKVNNLFNSVQAKSSFSWPRWPYVPF